MPSYKAVVLDMGDVLFSWNPQADTQVSVATLMRIGQSATWDQYECGIFSREECHRRLGEEFGVTPSELAATYLQTTGSLTPNRTLTAFLNQLKALGYRIYMMTNLPQFEWDLLRATEYAWGLFDDVFVSGYVGMRKPDLAFYKHVLQAIGQDPGEVIFVDDRQENVEAAQEVGIAGIQFQNATQTCAKLAALLGIQPLGD